MFLCYITAAYAFLKWIDDGKAKYYWIALVGTALAILAKANAAHIGLFFAAVLLREKGLGSLRSWLVWLFAILSLVPAALWYHHAHNLWLAYGNSLGVSNEYHWIGRDFLTDSEFITGILSVEVSHVWTVPGLLVAALGVFLRRGKKEVSISLYWLGAVVCYYLIAARTSGETWATYYHIVSIPAASILFGSGVVVICGLMSGLRRWSKSRVALGLIGLAAILIGIVFRSKLMIIASGLATLVGLIGHKVPPEFEDDHFVSSGWAKSRWTRT